MNSLFNATFSALTEWLGHVKRAVFPALPGTEMRGGLPPDPAGITEVTPEWNRLTEKLIVPEVDAILANKLDDIRTLAEWRADYLQGTRNRLARVPDELHDVVVRSLADGLTENETPRQLRDRVQEIIAGNGMEDWRNRAETIARTESIGAENAATIMQATDEQRHTGVLLDKVWLSTADGKTRETHREADGQRVPVDSTFDVGQARLAWPGDHASLFPAEVINCRCTVVIVERDDEWP